MLVTAVLEKNSNFMLTLVDILSVITGIVYE